MCFFVLCWRWANHSCKLFGFFQTIFYFNPIILFTLIGRMDINIYWSVFVSVANGRIIMAAPVFCGRGHKFMIKNSAYIWKICYSPWCQVYVKRRKWLKIKACIYLTMKVGMQSLCCIGDVVLFNYFLLALYKCLVHDYA